MKHQSKESVLVLANAVTVVTGVIGQLAGSQVAGTLGGNPATQEALTDLVASHVQKRLGYEANFLRKD
jgi:hypothetical protein